MWELWTLMWILCYSQIIRIKKYSVTKYCRCAQRNPNKNVHLKKVLPPPQRNGLVPSSCHALRLNATTLLYKRVYFIKGTVVQWTKIYGVIDCKCHILLEKTNFTGTQTHRTPPKCTARHRKTNPAIFQPIPDRLQSRGRSTPKRGFVVSTPVQNHHLPLEGHLSSTTSSLSMPSCDISL